MKRKLFFKAFLVLCICSLLIHINQTHIFAGESTGWVYINENWYYYENDIIQTGWQFINNQWYYFNDAGIMKTGWLYDREHWYYLSNNGNMVIGWLQIDNQWYYFDDLGQMVNGWNMINNKKYLFNADGQLVDGAQYFIIDVSKYQYNINWTNVLNANIDGVILRCSYGMNIDSMFTSYLKELERLSIPYGIYHFNTADNIEEAKIQAENVIKIVTDNHANPTLPIFVDIESYGNQCDLNEIAKTYCAQFIENDYLPGIYANSYYWNNYLNDYSLNAYYKWIAYYGTTENNKNAVPSATFQLTNNIENYMMWQYTSQGKISGISENTVDCNAMFEWYLKSEGWRKIENQWYYYHSNGYIAYEWQLINDIWYYFNNQGIMQKDWQLINDYWYYFNSNGEMLTHWQYIDNNWYYFNNSGYMETGWIYFNNNWYYLDISGKMLTGWQYINNNWYYLTENGNMVTGSYKINGTIYYFSDSGEWIK